MVTDGLAAQAPLFVPGDRPERFAKAATSGADAVIVDLEDAVSPQNKGSARATLRTDFASIPVYVRINAAGSSDFEEDLEAIGRVSPAAVVLPKVSSSQQIDLVVKRAAGIPIIALIETAAGLASARQIAQHPVVGRLAFGAVDYSLDLGCAPSRDALLAARHEIVLASRLAFIPSPLDAPSLALDDFDLVEGDANYASSMGFGGKLCIHPKQVPAVLKGFHPTAVELAWARKVLEIGEGAGASGGQMVDAPVRVRAERLLRRASGSGEN